MECVSDDNYDVEEEMESEEEASEFIARFSTSTVSLKFFFIQKSQCNKNVVHQQYIEHTVSHCI